MPSEVKQMLDSLTTYLKASDLKSVGEQLVAAFKQLVTIFAAMKKDILKERDDRTTEFEAALTNLRTQIDRRLAKVQDGKTPTTAELLALITPLIPAEAEDGHTPTGEELLALITPLIPSLENTDPDTADEIRNKLEVLPDGSKLSIDAIDGLAAALKKLSDRVTHQLAGGNVNVGSMASQAGRDIFSDIDLSAQLNGVTTTFNIRAVYNVISVHLSSFPNALRKNIDFTYTPTTITFVGIDAATSLAAGQTCVLTVVNA